MAPCEIMPGDSVVGLYVVFCTGGTGAGTVTGMASRYENGMLAYSGSL